MPQSFAITRPDDWHVHLRDGLYLQNTVPATANHFARALVMPNLLPPLTSLALLLDYHQRILAACPASIAFTPLLTFYLNEELSETDLYAAKKYPFIVGAKLYPAGATTNSATGPQSLKALYSLFSILQELDLVLQVHGELNRGDIFDREAQFIHHELIPILNNFPKLRIVLEHISTAEAVEFVFKGPERLAATITPHHLLYNRNQLLAGGLKPHYYCLPILKRKEDQQAVQKAALSSCPRFFAGTDSAPHAKKNKESACGCAGIFSAPYAIAMYAQFFAEAGHHALLNPFLSLFGAEFYKVSPNKEQLELVKKPLLIPPELTFGEETVVPIAAGDSFSWSVKE